MLAGERTTRPKTCIRHLRLFTTVRITLKDIFNASFTTQSPVYLLWQIRSPCAAVKPTPCSLEQQRRLQTEAQIWKCVGCPFSSDSGAIQCLPIFWESRSKSLDQRTLALLRSRAHHNHEPRSQWRWEGRTQTHSPHRPDLDPRWHELASAWHFLEFCYIAVVCKGILRGIFGTRWLNICISFKMEWKFRII